MKTIRFILLLGFLASPIFIFSNFRPQKQSPVHLQLQADAALNRLHIVVEKAESTPLTLQVTDEADGHLLYEKPLPTGLSRLRASLNLDGLPNGRYRVAVNDDQQVQTRFVDLVPAKHSALERQITVWPVD